MKTQREHTKKEKLLVIYGLSWTLNAIMGIIASVLIALFIDPRLKVLAIVTFCECILVMIGAIEAFIDYGRSRK